MSELIFILNFWRFCKMSRVFKLLKIETSILFQKNWPRKHHGDWIEFLGCVNVIFSKVWRKKISTTFVSSSKCASFRSILYLFSQSQGSILTQSRCTSVESHCLFQRTVYLLLANGKKRPGRCSLSANVHLILG